MLIGIDASRAFSTFWGGPEAYSYYLIRSILKAQSGHQFRLYLRPDSPQNPRYKEFFADLDPKGFQLSTLNFPLLWTQLGLALECLKNPPDVLFVPAHTLPILRRPSLPTVVTIHDLGAQYLLNYHKFPQKYYLNFATDYALSHATKIIAVSEYTKKDILNKFKVQSGKLKVIHEGFDREIFYPRSPEEVERVRKKYEVVGSYFLFVGTIQPRKNLVRLIEAFAALISKFEIRNSNLALVLAGAPGWLNGEIYTAPKEFGVEARVKFLGPVFANDLAALMSGAVAFVFPSLFEGFGLSPLEAMACGVPVILSNVTSLPEVGGAAAFYVDPNSVPDILEKMEQVLALGPAERPAVVEKVKAQAEKFSWEKAARETIEVLKEAGTAN